MNRRAKGRKNYRSIEIARAGWGAALLCAPETVLRDVHHVRIDRPSVVVTRVLGARQLAQAVLSGVRPSPEVLAMGVWVDVVHALSAVGLAVADRSRARAGLTDTVIAGSWAATGVYDLQRGAVPPPSHDRRRDLLARTVLGIVPGGGRLLLAAERDRRR